MFLSDCDFSYRVAAAHNVDAYGEIVAAETPSVDIIANNRDAIRNLKIFIKNFLPPGPSHWQRWNKKA